MFILGHIGIALGVIYAINARFRLGVDYRLVILGSLLPDIIDKPLGNIILHDALNNGRIIGHSFAFLLLLAVIGITYKKGVLYAAYGVLTHLILDWMWLNPVTLLWPLLGEFASTDFQFMDISRTIFEPYNIMGEAVGIAFLAIISARHGLYKLENAADFLVTGVLST